MPNYVTNILTFTFDDEKSKKRFMEIFPDGKFSMQKFLPVPEALVKFMRAYNDYRIHSDIHSAINRIGNSQFTKNIGSFGATFTKDGKILVKGLDGRKLQTIDEFLSERLAGCGDDAGEKLKAFFDECSGKQTKDIADAFVTFIDATGGYVHSNDWMTDVYGTKWDACSFNYDEDVVVTKKNGAFETEFLTAWSAPIPFLEALSKELPGMNANLVYYDEDYGSNYGEVNVKDGTAEYADELPWDEFVEQNDLEIDVEEYESEQATPKG